MLASGGKGREAESVTRDSSRMAEKGVTQEADKLRAPGGDDGVGFPRLFDVYQIQKVTILVGDIHGTGRVGGFAGTGEHWHLLEQVRVEVCCGVGVPGFGLRVCVTAVG